MSGIACYDLNGNPIKTFYQWDINQKIIIKGSSGSPVPVCHFCNRLSDKAIVVSPEFSDGNIIVKVPNILLKEPESILIYIYQENDGGSGKTINVIQIPVVKRKPPEDYEYEENIDYISLALIDARLTTILKYLADSSIDPISPEVIDIRTGYDGHLYDTAGDAVRALGKMMEEFKTNEAVNGLKFEKGFLYLTSNGEVVSDPVRITSGGGSTDIDIGEGLKWSSDGKLTVDTANEVQQDNTKPITSAAVYATVGNIEAFLKTI